MSPMPPIASHHGLEKQAGPIDSPEKESGRVDERESRLKANDLRVASDSSFGAFKLTAANVSPARPNVLLSISPFFP